MSKVLIDLDNGLLARIERERLLVERATTTAATETKPEKPGKRPPRTAMIRSLLTESMDARCLARGEEIPVAVEASEPETDNVAPNASESV